MRPRRSMRRLIVLAGVVAAFVSVPFFIFGETFERLFSGNGTLDWLRGFGPMAWAVGVGLLVADIALPVPTTAVMAALGMIYGPLAGGTVAAAGSVVSGVIAYGLCRYLGRPIAVRLTDAHALELGEGVLASTGGWLVALSRWLPVLSEVIACLAGVMLMPFRTFAAALACGSVPLGFTFAVIGDAGAEHPLATLFGSAVVPIILWAMVRPFCRARRLGE